MYNSHRWAKWRYMYRWFVSTHTYCIDIIIALATQWQNYFISVARVFFSKFIHFFFDTLIHSLPVSVTLFHYLTLSLSISISFSLSIFLSICLSLFNSLTLSITPTPVLFLSVYLSVYLSISMYLSMYFLSISHSMCQQEVWKRQGTIGSFPWSLMNDFLLLFDICTDCHECTCQLQV